MSQVVYNMSEEDRKFEALKNKRRQYTSLDEYAREEGVEAVLAFLATQPTIVGNKYRHSQMAVLPYIVEKYTK